MNALADSIRAQIEGASQLYHRLVLVVGGQRSGKTTALRELSESGSLPFVNLNLALSQRLLEFTAKARSLRLPKLLAEIVASAGGGVVILDNIEILVRPRPAARSAAVPSGSLAKPDHRRELERQRERQDVDLRGTGAPRVPTLHGRPGDHRPRRSICRPAHG